MGITDSLKSFGQSMEQRASRLVTDTARNIGQQAIGMARNAASNAVNASLSQLPGALRGIAGSMANQALGGILGGCAGGSMYSDPEDFNQLRIINKKLVQSEFVQEWNFRLEIERQPPDFDLYIKDISYGAFEIGNDEDNYGSSTFSWPTIGQPVRISFTARDNYDLRMAAFLNSWYMQVINNNGTVGLPMGKDGYVRMVRIYHVKSSSAEIPVYRAKCYPLQYGDATRSHENGQFMEMPVTLMEFSTLYNL